MIELPNYLVFDLETQTNTTNKRKANPFNKANYCVMRGTKTYKDSCAKATYFDHAYAPNNYLVIPDGVTMLVGHNIKFDLLYELVSNQENIVQFIRRGGVIWDTQLAEYILNSFGRDSHFLPLNKVAATYGGTKKIDVIKEMWDKGVQTSEIDRGLLEEYLIGSKESGYNSGDIGNTELVFKEQYKIVVERGILPNVTSRMQSLLATVFMEYFGVHIDKDVLLRDMKTMEEELAGIELELQKYIADIPAEVEFNWGSSMHMSCLLFGGYIKYSKKSTYNDETGKLARSVLVLDYPLFSDTPVDYSVLTKKDGYYYNYQGTMQDTYKTGARAGEPKFKKVKVPGEPKMKLMDFFHRCTSITEPHKSWKGARSDGMGNAIYSVNTEVIEELAERDIPFIRMYHKSQYLKKQIKTYYQGILDCLDETTSIVHHGLNLTSTVTGRLSSSNPNFQNIPRGNTSGVKACFNSRWGADGNMVEVDYSQLEVVVSAFLSNDKQLIEDLSKKLDFHCKRVAAQFNISYDDAIVFCKDKDKSPDFDLWSGRRTDCKSMVFQMSYGAGAAAISASTGKPVDEVKEFMKLEELTYPGIVTYQARVANEVEATSTPFVDPTYGFKTFRKGTYTAPTGTSYEFRSYPAPEFLQSRGILDNFKPTEMKNYPIQGTGSEFVQLAVGKLIKMFINTNFYNHKAYLVNTVHDCVWVDTHKSCTQQVLKDVKRVMEYLPTFIEKTYGLPCPVDFPAEGHFGLNLKSL